MSAPVSLRLRSRLPDLQPALRRIAEILLADSAGAAAMTIGQLARAAECSEATVVRFAHEVGFDGYRDLRFHLHEEAVALQQRAVQDGYAGDIDPQDDLGTVVGKIAAADSRAAQDTARGLDLSALAATAEAILTARRIVLLGVGASGLAAVDLQQKLSRIGLLATSHLEAHEALCTTALLEAEDVLVCISHTGRTDEVVAAMRLAAKGPATTVAVTAATASPLAVAADHVLLTAAIESTFRSGATASRIAQLTVVDCIFVAVAQQLPDLGRDALRRTREAVESRRLR